MRIILLFWGINKFLKKSLTFFFPDFRWHSWHFDGHSCFVNGQMSFINLGKLSIFQVTQIVHSFCRHQLVAFHQFRWLAAAHDFLDLGHLATQTKLRLSRLAFLISTLCSAPAHLETQNLTLWPWISINADFTAKVLKWFEIEQILVK